MGRSSFVHVGGSMLSAFSFREFRGINSKAVSVYICACLGSTAFRIAVAVLLSMKPKWQNEYSALVRFMHPTRYTVRVRKRNSSRHEMHRSVRPFPQLLF